jgi:hypothetical protein
MFPLYPTERVLWSFGAVLNAVAGAFCIFAKAVGRVAADPDKTQEVVDE